MARHSWLKKGVKYNFCLKCGVKKSHSNRKKCPMATPRVQSQLEHEFVLIEQRYRTGVYKCKRCEITTGIWYANHYESWAPEEVDTDGTLKYKKLKFLSYENYDFPKTRIFLQAKYKIVKNYAGHLVGKAVGRYPSDSEEVKSLPIYCGLTEDEGDIKDIIE